MTAAPPALTVVVPCFNEEAVLLETSRRLDLLLGRLVEDGVVSPDSYVCYVDDGSRDRTWALIGEARLRSARVAGLKLSRNRGHQNALMAGLLQARGDVVVSVDADLQDDLDAIPRMLAAAAEGADIVYGVRSARRTDTAGKRLSAHLYYHLLRSLGVEIVFDHADFRLLTRRAIEALRAYEETNLFLRALIPQLGFQTAIVTYERTERFAGTSKYPLRKMLALALEGITSFSTRPLRVVTLVGIVTSVLSVGLAFWALALALVFRTVVPGWASTVIPIYIMAGVQLMSLGVVGEYVGKIYLEAKHRPRFHIAQALEPGEGATPRGN